MTQTNGKAPPNFDTQEHAVIFATPAFNGQLDADYGWALHKTTAQLMVNHVRHDWWINSSTGSIQMARSHLASKFLREAPDATHLFFIDSDMSWQPADVMRIISSGKDVASGTYLKKQPFNMEWTHHPQLDDEGQTIQCKETDMVKCRRVPTGFLCIRRHVLEAMADRLEDLAYFGNPHPDTKEKTKEFAYFEDLTFLDPHVKQNGTANAFFENYNAPFKEEPRRFSEDYVFSERCRALGFEMWIDIKCDLVHYGRYGWANRMAEPAVARHYEQLKAEQAAKALEEQTRQTILAEQEVEKAAQS